VLALCVARTPLAPLPAVAATGDVSERTA
jgi:hypothetical protein